MVLAVVAAAAAAVERGAGELLRGVEVGWKGRGARRREGGGPGRGRSLEGCDARWR